jgi:trigger factor
LETTVTKVSSCLKEIEITAKDEEIQKYYKDTLDKYVKNVSLPGFRKGKAPMPMLMKLFGTAIEDDFKETVINEQIKKTIEAEKIQPVSPAKVIKEEYKKGESFYFKVQIETFPEFELKQYKGLEFEKQIFKAKEEEMEEEFRRLMESQRILTDDTKAIDDNYTITLDVQEVDKTGVPIIGHRNENQTVALNDKNVDPEIKEKLSNVSVNDVVQIRFAAQENPPKPELNVDLIIKKVQKISYPELNEELIKKISGNKFSTVEEFKKDILNLIQKQYDNLTENMLASVIDEELIKKNDFDVADTMVENYLNGMIEETKNSQPNKTLPSGFKVEDYKNQNRAYAINRIKAYYIHNKISEVENLKVDDVDLNLHAETEAQRTGISKERLLSYYKSSDNVIERLIQKKFDQFIRDNNKIIEKEYTGNAEENKIITA